MFLSHDNLLLMMLPTIMNKTVDTFEQNKRFLSASFRNFKNKIHQFLLEVFGNEDDYVDVSTLMLKITNYH